MGLKRQEKEDCYFWLCVDFSIFNGTMRNKCPLPVKRFRFYIFINAVYRAIMTDGENIGPTCLVLEPVSLAVYLGRNLSPWYHEVPDIDVMGKLHAVKVSSGFVCLRPQTHGAIYCNIYFIKCSYFRSLIL